MGGPEDDTFISEGFHYRPEIHLDSSFPFLLLLAVRSLERRTGGRCGWGRGIPGRGKEFHIKVRE